jgi:methylmalonyl-CoA mutase
MSTPVLMAMFQAAGRVPGHSEFDPIAELTQHGSLPFSLTISTRLMADSIRSLNKETPGSVIGVSGEVYHNAGASAVEELACVLATAVEYVSRLQEAGLNVDDITSRMRFTFPVGTRFFMEVAKLRAARLLWARVVKLFGAKDEDSMKMRMHVRTSWWNQTTKDPYVNMLRATVENMAGAIGGANSMHTAPFDEVSGSPGQISLRNARNIQVVLQEEAHLSQVGDPAAGSYYVEQLTDAVARKSWEFFQEIERHGGALKALQEGFIQEKIKKTAAARKERISMRKDIIVGTNQYPNLTEKPLVGPVDDPEGVRKTAMDALQRYLHERGDITKTVNTLQKSAEDPTENMIVAVRNAAKSGILASEVADILRNVSADSIQVAPLTQFRASEHFEKLRMAVETADKRPRVFLATLGPVFWRRARATFASGLFGTAGMDIKDNIGFDTIDAAAEAAVEDGADIIVACSDDESYREMVPELLKALRTRHSDMLVVVAGSPVEDIEMLTRAGVHSFIHVRSDVSVELAGILTTLGIDIQ